MSKLRSKVKEEKIEPVEVEAVEVEEVSELESNDEISVIDNAVKKSKLVKVVTEEKASEPTVRIKPKTSIRTYIGDQWYNLTAGKVVNVPKNVKEILQKAGKLDAI